MSKTVISLLAILILGVITFWYFTQGKSNSNMSINKSATETNNKQFRFIPIGDSYTIGLGVSESDRWPNVLMGHLKEVGLNVELVTNPAVSGYEVTDAITEELPQVKKLKPDFVTVLIGANDNFRETPVDIYEKDLIELLDQLQPMLSNPKNIVLITIPDYSESPAGIQYGAGEKISKGIEEYNQVIKQEAEKRDLKIADIFPVSQTMTNPEDYISDGLHPSAAGYIKWEKVILPAVLDLLN